MDPASKTLNRELRRKAWRRAGKQVQSLNQSSSSDPNDSDGSADNPRSRSISPHCSLSPHRSSSGSSPHPPDSSSPAAADLAGVGSPDHSDPNIDAVGELDEILDCASQSSASDLQPEAAAHVNLKMPPQDIPEFLVPKLQTWAAKGVSHQKVDELLKIMSNVFDFLPLTARGLLHTPRHTETDTVEGGEIWYHGIRKSVMCRLSQEYLIKHGKVVIDVGIDGIPLTESGVSDFWPIMGLLEGDKKPFVVSVFCGPGKPTSLSDYFDRYCTEVLELEESGIEFGGQVYSFQINQYILDAVARQQMKCVSGPCSEAACEKCTVRGVRFKNRETFIDLHCPLRTDESFAAREDPAHHTGISPLESRLKTKMITQFRLDPMHLIHLGIMKRLLHQLLRKGPRKLHWTIVKMLSSALIFASSYLPREFSRLQFKDLKYFSRFKATEFRALLLYLLVSIFKLIPKESEVIYKNFLLLHVSVFIMSSEVLLAEHCDLAERFAFAFVEHSIALFGREFCVYNVHSLIHIPSECRSHGILEKFSAYPFENLLQILVNIVKSGNQPLQQLINRLTEREKYLSECNPVVEREFILEQEVKGSDLGGKEYLLIKLKRGFCLGVNKRDRCFCANDDSIVVLSNIVQRRGKVLLFGRKFELKENFYSYPINSSILGIYKVSNIGSQKIVVELADVKNKCVLLPDPPAPSEGGHCSFLCLPMLHTLVEAETYEQ